MKRRADGWDAEFAADVLQHLQVMHGTMPPYAGNEEDRKALGSYLAGLNPPWHFTITDANRLEIGEKVFDSRCGHCHTINGKYRPLRGVFEKQSPSDVQGMFAVLGSDEPGYAELQCARRPGPGAGRLHRAARPTSRCRPAPLRRRCRPAVRSLK